MNKRILAFLLSPILLADAPAPSMTVSNWASGCSDAMGVVAEHVGKGDHPEAAMDREALTVCPAGYVVTGKFVQHSAAEGKSVTWTIRCGKPDPKPKKTMKVARARTHSSCGG